MQHEDRSIIDKAYEEWCDFVCMVVGELANEPDIMNRVHRQKFEQIFTKALDAYRADTRPVQ